MARQRIDPVVAASLGRGARAGARRRAVLCRHPQLTPHLLPIDFRETPDAVWTNVVTRRQAIERRQRGEAFGIFPAGGVATSRGCWSRPRDLEWKRFVAKPIRMSRATVVPVYIHGENSRLFQVVSQFSPTLRLALLLHEVRNKRGRRIRLDVGEPIPYEALSAIKGREALLSHLWEVTHTLASPRPKCGL